MDTDYFSYKKDMMKEKEEDEEMEYREPQQTMVQWGMMEKNNKPSLYTAKKGEAAITEPLLIPNNGAKDTHKHRKPSKRLAHTFPNTKNTFGGADLSKQEKRKSQPTFLFTVGSLQKEENPVPWPESLISKSHEKQRRRQYRSNGYNKSAYDEQEDLIFSMDDT